MKYRKLGKTNEEVSILGFGCMRFPQKNGKIDEIEATKMLKFAIDNGLNYIDTAYIYHDGESEAFVGRALSGEYRNKVKLATKLPTWLVKSRDDMDKFLHEQLERLNTEQIDFYLIHNLNREIYNMIKSYGLFEFLDKIKEEKLVKYIGFSFHDTIDLYKEIIDDYDWDFTQIQYNYIDEDYQAGTEGLLYAASKNLGIIVMEPLRGGALVNKIPPKALEIMNNSNINKSPAEWAFKFLYNKEQISVVLSGMSTIEQVNDNLRIANDHGESNSLIEDEKVILDKLRDEFNSKIRVNCTGCKYCIPCPMDINIPQCFELLNNAYMFDDISVNKEIYNKYLVREDKDASKCIDCGVCESKCPQHIQIRDMLKNVCETFGRLSDISI